MKNNQDTARTPKELFNELQALVAEAETMMGDSLSEHSAEAIDSLRSRFIATQERFAEVAAANFTVAMVNAGSPEANIEID